MSKEPNGEGIDPREFFGDLEWEDTELSPESERMLEDVLRSKTFSGGRLINADPRSRPTAREIGLRTHEEIAAAISDRLFELQVRDVRNTAGVDLFTRRHVERFPDLDTAPHLIDDMHYEVYNRRKAESTSPFVSISLDEILSELTMMRETSVNPINLQRRQVGEAVKFFLGLKVEEGSIYHTMQTNEGRFVVRSMHRLLQERTMAAFLKKFCETVTDIEDESYSDFPEFATRALKWFAAVHVDNALLSKSSAVTEEAFFSEFLPIDGQEQDEPKTPPTTEVKKRIKGNDPDELAWYELRTRSLDRAAAIAKPVGRYLAKLPPAEAQQ